MEFGFHTIRKFKFLTKNQHFHRFTSFSPTFFWQFFSRNQSCQQLKGPKPQHFHEFFTKENQSWIFGQKMKISNSVDSIFLHWTNIWFVSFLFYSLFSRLEFLEKTSTLAFLFGRFSDTPQRYWKRSFLNFNSYLGVPFQLTLQQFQSIFFLFFWLIKL